METKPDLVLKRLDEWGEGLMRRNYTSNVAQKVKEGVRRAVRDIYQENPEDCPFDLEELLKEYEVENMCAMTQGLYSKWYTLSETFLHTGELEERGIRLSKGVREEYLDPIKEAVKPFNDFVQDLRSSAIPPQEQTDQSINSLFRNRFPTPDSYLAFCKQVIKASFMLSQLDQDEKTKQLSNLVSRIMDYVIDTYIPAIMRDVYSFQSP